MLRHTLRPRAGIRVLTVMCFFLGLLVLQGGCAPAAQAVSGPVVGAAPVYAWVEGEEPASANFEGYWTSADRPHLVSGGAWLAARVEKNDIAEEVPQEGLLLTYDLQVPEDGEYHAWARVGFEWSRSPLQWRLGASEWRDAPADQATFNVMQMKDWNDLGWQDLGSTQLKKGRDTLSIRCKGPREDREYIWFGLDCFAFVMGPWVPDGRLKPGETYNAEQDLKAAEQVYRFPEAAADAQRTGLKLNGLWQIARYDQEDMDIGAWEPVRELPSHPLHWLGVEVPHSCWGTDEMVFAHRVIYRTRVNVPASHEGRGFKLHFSGTNWIASVFINGDLAGTHEGVWIPWDLDVSDHVRPGQANEIAVVIKGPYYAMDVQNDPRLKDHPDLERGRNRPRAQLDWVFWVAPIRPSTKGDGNGEDYGIVNPVTLVSLGDAYTEDIFVKPGLDRNREKRLLGLEVTVHNAAQRMRTFQVQCQAVHDPTGEVEKEFTPMELTVPATESRTVRMTEEWPDPKLWWPEPNPDLYRLRTTILEDGRPLDVQEELFGYRWVTVKDGGIYINGVRRNFWNWVNVAGRPPTGEEWLDQFRKENNRFTRFSMNRKTSTFMPSREERLEFYDRNGIAGRLCSMIDGMNISRSLGDRVQHPVTGEGLLIPNWPVWEGFQRHLEQLAKAYRNHPSVIFYQTENELVYITGMNVYGAYLDQLEDLMGHCIEAARSLDPTRPYSVGGAGDLDCQCEINCPHYPLGPYDWYPENAYTIEKIKERIEMYPAWGNGKPWYVGESAYANDLERASYLIGDPAFRSAHDAARGKAAFLRMLYGGYRWAGVAGYAPWCNLYGHEDADKVFSDLYVVPRKQTCRLFAGRENELLLKLINDTLHTDRVKFEWDYRVGEEVIARGGDNLACKQGFGREVAVTIKAPETGARLEGKLTLRLSLADSDEAPPYVDVRDVPVLPPVAAVDVAGPVFVLDRSGQTAGFLTEAGVQFTRAEALSDVEGKTGLLVVGHDTLTPAEAFGRGILAFAGQGGRVIVLEQENVVCGANLPVPLNATVHYGGYAHPQALGTALFKDLGKDDLIDWAGDHPSYKNAYEKPTRGGRSLAECGMLLPHTPLVEMPAGTGVIVLCQFRVGAKLGVDPAAGVLLRNMMEHYGDYRPPTGVAAVYAPDDSMLAERVAASGSLTQTVDSVAAALDAGRFRAAVIHATEANLKALNVAADRAKAFQEAGGWLLLCGLAPDGIEEYNRFLGRDHLIRPFRMERVTLEAPGFPLAATLGNRDLAMYSAEHLQHDKNWISWNVYTYAVDAHADVSPFAQTPESPEDITIYEKTWDDHDPYNYVNDLLRVDHWRYIRQIWIGDDETEKVLTFRFRRPETLSAIRIWNNATYSSIEDTSIIFDGNEAEALHVILPDDWALTEVALPEPRTVQETVTLRVGTWRPHRPREGGILVGIENVEFVRAEVPDDVVCLDNVGGLVAYPRGKGGTFLCQVKFMKEEPNPVNDGKKQRILNVLLQNMGVGSKSSTVAMPGVNVRYEPVDLLDHCTQYLAAHDRQSGLFDYQTLDLRSLQVGEQRFGSILYHLVDYNTAPVFDCIVLGLGQTPKEVTGIDVGKKADLLFFLQTSRVRRPITPEERSDIAEGAFRLPEVMRYVVHYADGETAEIPVVLEEHVDHWLQAAGRPLPGALVAATVRVPNIEALDEDGLRRQLNLSGDEPTPPASDVRAILYTMQVDNPRPDVEIESIDAVMAGNRAYPAVLAITLGQVAR